jgi:hypothetical protein
MYGRFINDIFGGFINLFIGRLWSSEAESGVSPIASGVSPIASGVSPIA